MYPYDKGHGQIIKSDVGSITPDRAFIAHLEITAAQAAALDEDGVHAAVTGSNSEAVVVTEDISNPPYPRNIIITPGGTTADVAAGNITITGTNINDEEITEEIAITENAAALVTGAKAFKTVTQIDIPQQDGAAATFLFGWGDKLGLPYKLEHNTVLKTYLGDALEGTAPTVVADSDEIEKNTIDLNSALNGSAVDVYLMV